MTEIGGFLQMRVEDYIILLKGSSLQSAVISFEKESLTT
jgi:hypothetical protein